MRAGVGAGPAALLKTEPLNLPEETSVRERRNCSIGLKTLFSVPSYFFSSLPSSLLVPPTTLDSSFSALFRPKLLFYLKLAKGNPFLDSWFKELELISEEFLVFAYVSSFT